MKTRLLIYFLFGLIVTLVILFAVPVVQTGLTKTSLEADYMGFLNGAYMISGGHGSAVQLYDLSLQQQVEVGVVTSNGLDHLARLLPFVTIPAYTLFFLPLRYLPIAMGFLLWGLIQLLLLALSLWLLRDLLPAKYRYLLWLGAFAFLPLYQSLVEGQLGPTLLLTTTLLWHGLHEGSARGKWYAGASLALMLIKPQMLPLYLLYLLYKRNWRALGGFAIAAAGIYFISAAVAGFDWPIPYLHMLGWFDDPQGVLARVMFNLLGLFVRLGIASNPLVLTLDVLVVAALVYAWWRSDQGSVADAGNRVGRLELQLAATTMAATLINPHLLTHDLTILIFTGAVLLGWSAQAGWPIGLNALLLISLLTNFTFFAGAPLDIIYIILMLSMLGTLIYLLCSAMSAAKPGVAEPLSAIT